MKNDYHITRQLQDDLIEAYKKVAPTSWTQTEAYKKAVKLPAPRYYITPKQALQVISPMVKGDFSRVNLMLENKKRMYYSLFDKVMELSEKREFIGKSLSYIMNFAVAQPAPEFFANPCILQRMRFIIKHNLVDDSGKPAMTESRIRAYEKLKEKRRKLREYREMRKAMKQERELQ